MPTFAEVLTPRTATQIYEDMRAEFDATLVALGKSPVTDTWKVGNVLRTALRVCATVISLGDSAVALLGTGASLDKNTGAKGGILDARLSGYEGITRNTGYASTGYVTIYNGTASAGDILAGAELFRSPTTQVIYVATASATIAPSTSQAVPIVAQATGTLGDAAPGTITEFVSPRTSWTCTNAAPVLGADNEEDSAYIDRGLDTPLRRQPGLTNAKIRASVLDVAAHGVAVTRTRVYRTIIGSNPGWVKVVLAKASGGVTTPERDTILGYLIATVLQDSGGFVVVSANEVSLGSAAVTLWVPTADTRTDAQIISRSSIVLSQAIAASPIGGYQTGAGGTAEISAGILTGKLALSEANGGAAVPLATGLPSAALGPDDVATAPAWSYQVKRF